MPVDVLVVDDGSTRPHRRRSAASRRAGGLATSDSRGLGAALRTGLELARDEGYDAAVYLDGDGEYDPADFERVLDPVARGRADYVLGSRFLGDRDGMTLAPHARQPPHERAARHADGDACIERRPDRLPRLLRPGAGRAPGSATTTTTRRC